MTATETQSRLTRQGENGVAPIDYGKLNAVYGAVLAAVVLAARRPSAESVRAPELLPLGAATFALSKVITKEKVGSFVREPFVEESAENGRRPRGHGMRAAVGELVTCSRCTGAWSAAAIVGLRVASPTAGRAVSSVLATSALNDMMHAGFNWLTARADRAGA